MEEAEGVMKEKPRCTEYEDITWEEEWKQEDQGADNSDTPSGTEDNRQKEQTLKVGVECQVQRWESK